MDLLAMTDEAIARELGRRIDQIRLERNMTQQQLADAIGISRVSYAKLAAGHGKFINVIAVLRALDQLALVEGFIPETAFSPIEQLKMKGRQRQRASGSQADTGSLDDKQVLDW